MISKYEAIGKKAVFLGSNLQQIYGYRHRGSELQFDLRGRTQRVGRCEVYIELEIYLSTTGSIISHI